MNQSSIIAMFISFIIVCAIIYQFIIKPVRLKNDTEEIVGPTPGPTPDTVDEIITGGDDETIPDEDETSLETAPVDGEDIVETSNVSVAVEGYMIKK